METEEELKLEEFTTRWGIMKILIFMSEIFLNCVILTREPQELSIT